MGFDALEAACGRFLAGDPLAVAGVSRTGREAANAIFRNLTGTGGGRTVWPVNPAADEVEGVRCYPSLDALPGRPTGLVIATPPSAALGLVEASIRLGVPRLWFHRSFGPGSVSPEAVALARQAGIEVIAGACPLMFGPSPDPFHRCVRWFLKVSGGLPEAPGVSGSASR